MQTVLKYIVLSLALTAFAAGIASCGSAATATPTETPTVLHTASPTTTGASVATREPTDAPTAVPTAKPTDPPSAEDLVPRITLEELKALMDAGTRIAILDVRPRESYDLGHIKGAVSFPWKPELSYVDVEMLPGGDPIITYCDCGPGEADSANVAVQLTELGATAEFKVLAHPAIEGWIELGYPTEGNGLR